MAEGRQLGARWAPVTPAPRGGCGGLSCAELPPSPTPPPRQRRGPGPPGLGRSAPAPLPPPRVAGSGVRAPARTCARWSLLGAGGDFGALPLRGDCAVVLPLGGKRCWPVAAVALLVPRVWDFAADPQDKPWRRSRGVGAGCLCPRGLACAAEVGSLLVPLVSASR